MMLVENWISSQIPFLMASSESLRAVSVAIFREKDNEIEVLIGKRGGSPEIGKMALPGGHVDEGESLIQASIREIKEETGISLRPEQLVLVGREKREKSKNGKDYVDVVFCAKVPYDTSFHAASDLEMLSWEPVVKLPDLAFDHDKSIQKAVKAIQNKKASLIDSRTSVPSKK